MRALRKTIRKDSENLFIVIHGLGSHYAYNYRYPASFDHFQPSDEKNIIQPNLKELKQQYIY